MLHGVWFLLYFLFPSQVRVYLATFLLYIADIGQLVWRQATGLTARVRFSAGAREFSLLHSVQATQLVSNGYLAGKAAEALS
jgi:hypothetical protein